MRRVTKALVTGAVAAVAVTGFGATSARADTVGGGVDTSGPYVEASITIKRGGQTVRSGTGGGGVPAKCWWEPFSFSGFGGPTVDPDNPESVQAYIDYVAPFLSGHAAGARLTLPDRDYMAGIIRRVAAGEDLTFYRAKCRSGFNPVDEGLIENAGTWQGVNFGVEFQAFPPGEEPGPVVAAEVLADLAREELDIQVPTVDRNPKMPTDAGDATLVTYDTYFWVTNPGFALGTGGNGTVAVTATAGAPNSNDPFSTATVTATSDKITVNVGDGSTGAIPCDLDEAKNAYGPGSTAANSCSVKFQRASVGRPGGWPVTVAANWAVEWEGVEANGTVVDPTGLIFDAPTAVFNVPVAESQAVVDSSGR
jgi:hypothetical protein